MIKIITYEDFISERFFKCDITPKRTVEFYEIELYLKGTGATFINNLKYPHTKNRLVFAKPGNVRFSTGSFECFAVKFICTDIEICKLLNTFNNVVDLDSKAASAVMKIIKSGIDNSPKILKSHKDIFDILMLAFAESGNNIEKNESIPYYKRVMTAKDYIDANFGKQITLSDIAKGTYLSANFLRVKFTEIIGVSPHKYLCEIRLSTACKLLLTTSASISDIADICGFKSQSYMNYAFKKVFNCTPLKFRKSKLPSGCIETTNDTKTNPIFILP